MKSDYHGKKSYQNAESQYQLYNVKRKRPVFTYLMLIMLVFSTAILVGYFVLRSTGGAYHNWVYGLFVITLLLANQFRIGRSRRPKIGSYVASLVLFLVLTPMICIFANSEEVLNDLLMKSNACCDWPTTYFEYYNDNFVWHGRVYKEYIDGMGGSRVYTYDLHGDLITESD